MNKPQPTESEASSLYSVIGRIDHHICRETFPTGQRATLRHMTPTQPPPLQFYRFAVNNLPINWRTNEADWVTVVAGIALMAPTAHRPDVGLGKALAQTGYSESRLERLLESDGNTRRILILRAARFLAAKLTAFNWVDAAMLLFAGHEKQRNVHQRIAEDFYRNLKER